MRRDDIDRAKGLCILLVVFGHLVARRTPDHSAWSRAYDQARVAVYLCHMPVFFYLSGLVMVLSGAAATRPGAMRGYVLGRARRLLVPFVGFGVLIAAGKAALAGAGPVDNAPPGFFAGLLALVWDTWDSPALSVWYLAVLFMLAVAAPCALRTAGGRAAWLLGPALVLYVVPFPARIYADRLHVYALFFVLGLMAGQATGWLSLVDRAWPWAAAGLVALLGAVVTGVIPDIGMVGMPYDAYLLAAGGLAIPAVHGWVRGRLCPAPDGLRRLGVACFAIYLGNTIAIGLAKFALARVLPWTGCLLPVWLAPLMLAGVAGPLAARSVVRRRLPGLFWIIA